LDRVTLTIAHTAIVKRTDINLGIEETMRQRANLAGVHIGDPSLNGSIVQIDLPENLNPKEAARVCLKAVHAGTVTLSPGKQTSDDLLVQYLNKLKGAALESKAPTRNAPPINLHFYHSYCRSFRKELNFRV
jgi:hypothetical protein